MKSKDIVVYTVCGLAAAALILFSAMRMAKKPEPPPAAPFQRISLADMQRADAIVIDVRDVDSYIAGHIPGSLHIPLSYIDGEVPYLPKDKAIVTYCTCPAEESSGKAAEIITGHGLRASALLGGLEAWRAAGMPLHTGRQP